MNNPPAPGIYEGISFEEYASWPYLNNSGCTHLLRSPAHYQASLAEGDDDTKAKTRGTICHAGIWEPARFADLYAIGPDVKLNTKEGKTAWEAFIAAHPGKEHVRGADGAAMLGCRESIWRHPLAAKLLAGPGPCEVCIVWDDPTTGVRCKARIDKLATRAGFVVDLKTTSDARPESFRRSVLDHAYHRQAAFYLHGLAALDATYEGFAIIAVETKAPYAVSVLEMEQEAMDIGRVEAHAAMELYSLCAATSQWNPYPPQIRKTGLPEWKYRQELAAALTP